MNVIVLLEKSFVEGPFYNPPTVKIKGIYPWGPNGSRASMQALGLLESRHQPGTSYERKGMPIEDCSGFGIPESFVTGEFYLEDRDEKLWGYKASVGEFEKLRVNWSNCGEGYHGDYDPSDPNDDPLLRLDVQNGDEFLYSCCTLFPAVATEEQQKEALLMIATAIAAEPENLKRVCAEMSYIHLDEFGVPTIPEAPKLIKE